MHFKRPILLACPKCHHEINVPTTDGPHESVCVVCGRRNKYYVSHDGDDVNASFDDGFKEQIISPKELN